MSKSLNNIVDPWDVLTRYPLDSLKFYVLVNGPLQKDANFDEKDLVNLHNSFVDKVINCYTRIFGKNMLKNCDFDSTLEEVLEHTNDLHKVQSGILEDLEASKFEMNPQKS
jgi:methionyl-tRNA synthetase